MRRQALALPVLFVAGCIFDAPEDAVTDSAAASPTTMGATTDFYDIVYVAKGTQLRVYEGDVLTYTATDSSTFVELQEDPTLTGAVWALHQNGDLERWWWNASVDYGTRTQVPSQDMMCDLAIDEDGTPWVTTWSGGQSTLWSRDGAWDSTPIGATNGCARLATDGAKVYTLAGSALQEHTTGSSWTFSSTVSNTLHDLEVVDGRAFSHSISNGTRYIEVFSMDEDRVEAIQPVDHAITDIDTVQDSDGTWLFVSGSDSDHPVQRYLVIE